MNRLQDVCLQFKRDLEEIFQQRGKNVKIQIDENKDSSFPVASILVKVEASTPLCFLLTTSFPSSPPIVLIHQKDGPEQVQLPWDSNLSLQKRLRNALDAILPITGPIQKTYGTSNGMALTTDPKVAEMANWEPTYSSTSPEVLVEQIQEGLFSRTLGVLSNDILSKRVLVIGVGSVGSYISEQLVRSGVGQMTIVDPDIVEFSNLSRTVFTLQDINKSKVDALAGHLFNINPSIQLQCFEKEINAFDSDELSKLFLESDVIVATTDDPSAQRVINRFAYGNGKPAIFVGLYQGADGGEVIVTIPKQTPCYQCATSIRHSIEQSAGDVEVKTDYGTGKLEGVIALAADIHHVSSAAVKMVLSLLIPDHSQVKLKGFVSEGLKKGFSYLTFSMKDQYWFYPHIFEGVPGQYAYQSVWLTPVQNEECPICSHARSQSDLLMAPVTTPSSESIRKAFE